MLFTLVLFGIISANGQALFGDYDPNSVPTIIDPGQGGTVIDANGDWVTFASLPAGAPTSGAAHAYLNGKVYHFGGNLSSIYGEWDEATNVWTILGNMPGGGRAFFQAAVAGGKIYLIGGTTGWPTPTGMVEIFDGTTWSTGTSMPIAVHDAGYAVYQDRYIYVIGGMVGDWADYRNHVQIYDTQTDTWAVGTNFPAMKGCMAGGCVGNIICLTGAYDGDSTYSNAIYEGEINVSDPTIITWTTATATIRDPVYRPGGGVAGDMYINNMVFFVGGQDPISNQACGYDPVTDTYYQYPNKPTPLANIGNFVPGNNMMYVMGGYDSTYNVTCEGMEYTMIPIPVELISFTANASEGLVELSWITATETNNQGFEVERSSGGEFETITFVEGHGTTTETQTYSYSDRNVNVGSYSYRLKQIDFDGTFEYSDEIEVEVNGPLTFALEQNYPNPFNPTTTISYSLPLKSQVELAIYNALGESVMQLVNEEKPAGSYSVEFDAANLPSGIYFYRLRAGDFIETKKMILLK